MTVEEIDTLIEDTRRLSHVSDRVIQTMALGVLEIARQLSILNSTLASQGKTKPGI